VDHYEFLSVLVEDSVATVTIDRPDRLNTLNLPAHDEMERLWPDLEERTDVSAVVLRGSGGVFSAGGDVKDMLERARRSPGTGSGITPTRARRLVNSMLDFEKPVVAAVEGRAVGLGATLALLCDFVVAAEGSWFSDPHIDIGLVPGDGGAAIWAVVAGPHRARHMMMRGARVDAAYLHEIGVVVDVVPTGGAQGAAHALVRELLTKPPLALRGTKVAVNAFLRAQMASVLETSLAWEVATLRSRDFAEAVVALGEKRPATFTGE
jgi:enoyl-CoA hydratase